MTFPNATPYRHFEMAPDEKYLAEIRLLNANASIIEAKAKILNEIEKGMAITNEKFRKGSIDNTSYTYLMGYISGWYEGFSK